MVISPSHANILMNETKSIGLGELVTAIRNELDQVETSLFSGDREPILGLEGMELTVKFVVKEDSKVKGGFDLKVVALGSQLGESSESVQEITLTYKVLPEAEGAPGTRAYPDEKGRAKSKGIRPI